MAHTLERVWMFAMVLLFITSCHMGIPTVNCTAYTSASRMHTPNTVLAVRNRLSSASRSAAAWAAYSARRRAA